MTPVSTGDAVTNRLPNLPAITRVSPVSPVSPVEKSYLNARERKCRTPRDTSTPRALMDIKTTGDTGDTGDISGIAAEFRNRFVTGAVTKVSVLRRMCEAGR